MYTGYLNGCSQVFFYNMGDLSRSEFFNKDMGDHPKMDIIK